MPIPLLPELRFAAPGFLWLVPIVVLLALLGGRRGENAAVEFGALRLFGDGGAPTRGGLGGLAPPLLLLALLAGIFALARPQKVNEFELSTGEGIEIAIAIDVSYSMCVEDYQLKGRRVERLEAAKSVIKEFVKGRPNDRIGLVIFAGRPHNLGPLTMDHDWILEAIDRDVHFEHDIESGTAIGKAIAAPASKLAEREAKSKIIVLLTDGAHEGGGISPLDAASLAATLGIKIYPIAIGTPGRHYAPRIRAYLDQRFDLPTMQKIAAITKAKAYQGKDTTALRNVFAEIDKLEKSEVERRTVVETKEYFQWPAAAAALLALLGIAWELVPAEWPLINFVLQHDVTFATPSWLWALALLLPAFLMRVWGSMDGRDAVTLLVSPRLRDDLVFGAGKGRAAWRWWRFGLLSAAFACVIIALARPQWGEITQEEFGEGRSVMLGIDTSRSMLANDLTPNRLTRAKFAALDLVDALPGDQIGLMAFAGTSFVQVPLTTDREALADSIEQLDTYSISRGGTNLASAIKLASASFEDVGTQQHALILFSDGEELEGAAMEEAEKAAKKGMVIIAVGVGSTEGAIIPDPDSRVPGGSFIKDDSGKAVRTKLDTTGLEKIARATDGLFVHLDSKAMNADLVRNALSKLDSTETEGGLRTIPIERYQWPLGAGLLLLGLAVLSRLWQRRPSLAGAPTTAATAASLILLAAPGQSSGGMAADAYKLYQGGEFKRAADCYQEALQRTPSGNRAVQLQLGLGSSSLKAGDHKRALEAFGKALLSEDLGVQEDAHYNLGNALYRAGDERLKPPEPKEGAAPNASPPAPPSEAAVKSTLRDWSNAIEHYESTVAIDPENTNAAENIEFIKSRIKDLEEQQDQQQQQEGEDGDQQEPQEPQEEQGDEKEEQKDGQEDDKGEGGEEQEPSPGEEKQPGETGEDGDQKPGTQSESGDEEGIKEIPYAQQGEEEEVNEQTGYTVQQAKRQLEAFANEQDEVKRQRRRARARFFKDW